jgi:hypothetical protein
VSIRIRRPAFQGLLSASAVSPKRLTRPVGQGDVITVNIKLRFLLISASNSIWKLIFSRRQYTAQRTGFPQFVSWCGVRRGHLVRQPLFGLLYQYRMICDDECVAVGGMRIGRGNRSTRRKPASVPLCPLQIPHDLTWDRTRTAAVGTGFPFPRT